MRKLFVFFAASIWLGACQSDLPDGFYETITPTLEIANTYQINLNDSLKREFEQQIHDAGDRPEGLAVLNKLDSISQKTRELESELDSLVREVQYTSKKLSQKSTSSLNKKLKEYIKFINGRIGLKLPEILSDNYWDGLSPKETVSALIAVRHKINDSYEKLLIELVTATQGKLIICDKVDITYTCKSQKVLAGDMYEADMFFFQSASRLQSEFQVNNKPVNKVVNGVAYVSVPTQKGQGTPEGKLYQWTGTIEYTDKNGRKEGKTITGLYRVFSKK